MREIEVGRIVVDADGNEKPVFKTGWDSFPDKKRSSVNPEEIEKAVAQVRKIKEEAHVGQERAVWLPKLDYPDRPMLFLFLTDPHYTSIRSDHKLLNYYLDVVKNTPNMFLVTGGDDVDNFNATLGKVSSGVYEDPIEPGIQGRAWAEKMKELDHKDKIGFMVFGNHTDWTYAQGMDWHETYLGGMECPLLTSGGKVTVQFEKGARYEIAATHRYWGNSKLNPTNACKRYLEHEHPTADIVLLGHTHQSEILEFDRAGKQRIGVIGGSLKLADEYAKKRGIGGRAGTPGICIALWPDDQEMQGYKRFDRAVEEHIARLKR